MKKVSRPFSIKSNEGSLSSLRFHAVSNRKQDGNVSSQSHILQKNFVQENVRVLHCYCGIVTINFFNFAILLLQFRQITVFELPGQRPSL